MIIAATTGQRLTATPAPLMRCYDSATISAIQPASTRAICIAAEAHLADGSEGVPMARPSRRGRGAMTIEDVARAAGVSAMTVSRVINDGRNVRESTRAAVREAIERLNYSPNAAARSLAAGEITPIGLLYATPSAAYLAQFLIGALHAARSAGVHLVIESCESEDADEQAEVTRRFATSDVEGVVLPPPLSESQPILAELSAMQIPVVTVAMGAPSQDSLNVRIDDYAAAMEMARYLLELGHREMGFIKGHPNHVASHDRFSGF